MTRNRITRVFQLIGLAGVLFVGLNALLMIATMLTRTHFVIVDSVTHVPRGDTQCVVLAVAVLLSLLARSSGNQEQVVARRLSSYGAVCAVACIVIVFGMASQFMSRVASNALSEIVIQWVIVPATILGALTPALWRRMRSKK